VWGVIWLFIAFVFFISGVLVGIVAFKVCYSRKQILKYIIITIFDLAHMCFVGIGGSAKRRCEALFARSRDERRYSNVAIDTACTITQHLVIRITRFAMIINAHCTAQPSDILVMYTIAFNRIFIVVVVVFFVWCLK
jgi:hypothetical protein